MNEDNATEVWTVKPQTSLQSVRDEPACPVLLRKVLTRGVSWQMRCETSVDRTLRSSHLTPHWIAALLVLGARVSIDQPDGSVQVALDAFMRGTRKGNIAALHIPLPGIGTAWGEAHVARAPSDDPIVAALAYVVFRRQTVERARVALTGVWADGARLSAIPDALVGAPLTGERIADVCRSIEDEVYPKGDYRGSEAYRRTMAGVVTRRALLQCLAGEGDDD